MGEPEAGPPLDQITSTNQELSKLSRAAMNEQLDRIQASGTERDAGLDRGLGL